MTEAEFTQWVQKTHKEHKWQSHKIAELYSKVQVKKALEEIEKSLMSDEELTMYIPEIGGAANGKYQRNKTQEAINRLKKG